METSNRQFGLIVAYLLPGFIGLAGVTPFVPTVAEWLRPVNIGDGWLGPPVYAVLAAMAMGMIVSCVRWLLVDHVHQWTGLVRPELDHGRLESRLEAFSFWVENHYRYYQFYANTIIAVLWAYLINRILGTSPLLGIGTDLGVLTLCAILFAGSRDALRKYYVGIDRLLGQIAEKGIAGDSMTNGTHHPDNGGTATKPRPVTPVTGKPEQTQAKPGQNKGKANDTSK